MMKTFLVIIFLFFSSVPTAFAYMGGTDRYELSLGADVPFYIGAQARYNLNTQYYAKVGAGFALELFMNTHQRVLNELGVFKKNAVFSSALVNSVVFDGRLGWAQSIYEGPYLELGYSLLIWGKGTAKGKDINQSVGNSSLSDDNDYTVNIINHGPVGHIGYRFMLMDKLTLNMDVGAYKPLFSNTKHNSGGSGDVTKLNNLSLRELWFFSLGIWFSVSF